MTGAFYPSNLHTLGSRLRWALLKAGMTQADLAKALGVERQTVHRWVADENVPLPATLAKVAECLPVDEDWLLQPLGEP